MKKETLLTTLGILVILGGIIFYATMKPLPAKTPGDSSAALPLPPSTYTEHAAYYDITANYASSTPLGSKENKIAVALMQNFVSETIVQFKKDGNFANLTAADIKTMGFDQGRKEKLQIIYLIASSPRTISYIYTVYADTLGAHGNTYFKTFAFDTTTGANLSLADIFVPESNYLSKLSAISRQELPTLLAEGADAAMISAGTGPVASNFSNFFFDNKDFVILFDPYQVASYASGPQTLRIPVSLLSNTLKPEYR